jgi:putative DNA primase/helicase
MTPLGLYWDSGDDDKPAIWLSPPFEIVAHTRNPEGKDWGLLLRWYDLDNVMHEWAMPYSALGGRPEEIWRAMLAGGLRITSIRGGREKLAQYLSTAKSSLRARGVERTGWYIAPPIVAFVLPDKTYGESAYERIRWQTDNQGETLYRIAGCRAKALGVSGASRSGGARSAGGVSAIPGWRSVYRRPSGRRCYA